MVRSQATPQGGGDAGLEVTDEGAGDYDFVNMLNRQLPDSIRVTAWAPVPQGFNARFSCSARVYKYFFTRGALDVGRMQEGCRLLEGEHDFRNFCKIDVLNVSNFTRRILHASVSQMQGDAAAGDSGGSTWVFTVAGTAFLYHQVRCMVAVLFEIGVGREAPSLVTELLNVGERPRKPIYTMASEEGLVLWDCLFPEIKWRSHPGTHQRLLHHLTEQSQRQRLAPTILSQMGRQLRQKQHIGFSEQGGAVDPAVWEAVSGAHAALPLEVAPSTGQLAVNYKPILTRPLEAGYEEKVAALRGAKRQRKEENVAKAAEPRPAGEDDAVTAVALRVDLVKGIPQEYLDLD
eukprot:Hpha_TRINITY_DN23291_c0_g1::TRINITY_DN23291_c0_g1_i1::g.30226::m.30226/K01855/PUS3, DEG1; tRNA pseudouridine38/39 synthase